MYLALWDTKQLEAFQKLLLSLLKYVQVTGDTGAPEGSGIQFQHLLLHGTMWVESDKAGCGL